METVEKYNHEDPKEIPTISAQDVPLEEETLETDFQKMEIKTLTEKYNDAVCTLIRNKLNTFMISIGHATDFFCTVALYKGDKKKFVEEYANIFFNNLRDYHCDSTIKLILGFMKDYIDEPKKL